MHAAELQKKKQRREKIVCTTCYDSSMALLINQCPVDLVLVGDSVGNMMMGYPSTLEVTVEDMVRYTAAVSRVLESSKLLIADLPFLSYHNPSQALDHAALLIQKGGAYGIKLEGAYPHALEAVRRLKENGVAVMGHLGFTPQSLRILGGFYVQGKTPEAAEELRQKARDLEEAGAFALVLEMVPQELARTITLERSIPIIGIGAGKDVDGQILVLQDLLGISPKAPRFVQAYAKIGEQIIEALHSYSCEVKEGTFPAEQHSFKTPQNIN